jgi:hypothetical protein
MPEDEEEEPLARAVAASAWLLEHAQDLVSVIVGMVLIVLAPNSFPAWSTSSPACPRPLLKQRASICLTGFFWC